MGKAKTYTSADALSLGKAVVNGVKTYGQAQACANWAGENLDERGPLLCEAIGVAAKTKDKAQRKGALAVWNTTLKRVKGEGKEPAKGEKDMRPYLAHKVEGETVAVYWKQPEPKAEGAGEGDGEEQGETGGKPGDLTNAQLLALVKERALADESFAHEVAVLLGIG